MIQDLANIIYTPENIQKAKEYLLSRKVNSTKMRFPPTLTNQDSSLYWLFRKQYVPNIFTDSIYFPITDIEEPTRLIGFDVRYCGKDPTRLRYHKFKENSHTFMLYFTQDLDKIDPDKPLIVTEGVVDAETIRDLGYPVLSPLTAMHSFKFCLFLKAVSNRVYFAYDGDDAGKKAIASIGKETSIDPNFRKCFNFLNFSGKDLNKACMDFGKDYLLSVLKSQIQ